ncbi:hypothetical protein U1Q18_023247, partial [Sarracenia purpurea var. burkii]
RSVAGHITPYPVPNADSSPYPVPEEPLSRRRRLAPGSASLAVLRSSSFSLAILRSLRLSFSRHRSLSPVRFSRRDAVAHISRISVCIYRVRVCTTGDQDFRFVVFLLFI